MHIPDRLYQKGGYQVIQTALHYPTTIVLYYHTNVPIYNTLNKHTNMCVIYAHAYMYIYIYTHTYIYTNKHAHMYIYTHTYIYTNKHAHMYIYTHTRTYTLTFYIYIYSTTYSLTLTTCHNSQSAML